MEMELKNVYPGRTRLMFTCVLGRYVASTVLSVPKLQALAYDILPSTTAVFSYAIGSRSSSTFVTNNSNYIRRWFYN